MTEDENMQKAKLTASHSTHDSMTERWIFHWDTLVECNFLAYLCSLIMVENHKSLILTKFSSTIKEIAIIININIFCHVQLYHSLHLGTSEEHFAY